MTAENSTRVLKGGHGPDWVAESIPAPAPGPGQVLIRVHAAALNRVDLYMLEGSYDNSVQGCEPYPAGRECAGTIAAAGQGVDPALVGTPVMTTAAGSFADHVLVDARYVMPVPTGLSWAEASSLPVALGTEHDALLQTGFAAGDSVLVLGATSSIGLIGIQLVKALGASTVIATTTSDEKAATLKSLGADAVVNSSSTDMAETILELTAGQGVDVVLDHLAGTPLAAALPATAIGGTIVNIGRLAGRESTISLDSLSFRRLRLIGTTFSVRTANERALVYERLRDGVLDTVSAGQVKALVDQVLPFAEAKAAADALRTGAAIGKIVLDISGDAHQIPVPAGEVPAPTG